MLEQSVPGPAAGAAEWHENLALNLANVHCDAVPDKKKKKGVEKTISPEDKFIMAGLQAACHTKKLTNDYYLCVDVEYDGCTCCENLPDSRMPMTIVPLINPNLVGFLPPATGWVPIPLGNF